jgi:hypothetical protein
MDQHLPVKEYTGYFARVWENCPGFFPQLGHNYPPDEKKSREGLFEKFIDVLNSRSSKREMKARPEEKLTPVARSLFQSVFDYPDEQLDIILSEEYKQMTKNFIRMGRKFDAGMSLEDIFQACRNAWIMNGIQVMMGQPVSLTPAIFAYSMLYPYTDNYLDNPAITQQGKREFSLRFRERLNGGEARAINDAETRIFRLVEMIEGQFGRQEFPGVYESLLAIHDAQSKSLQLLDPNANLTAGEILNICIEKGGTSVLADGYLVAGDLDVGQGRFLFGFGTYLQLIDDIQDVAEDSNAGQLTVFSQISPARTLDEFTARTFHFGDKVFDLIGCFPGEKIMAFRNLMKKSVETMLIETILLNDKYYSPEFINKVEGGSPLSISYLKKRRGKLSPNRISYMKKIIESTIDDL